VNFAAMARDFFAVIEFFVWKFNLGLILLENIGFWV
jgi:hypothetical protein